LISVINSLSKGVKGRRTPTHLKTVWYIKRRAFPPGPIVHANRLPGSAWADGDAGIIGTTEGIEVVQ